jgi:hypothetical protein
MADGSLLIAARDRESVKRAKEHLASHYTPMTEPLCDAHALATDVLVLAREADGLTAECDKWRDVSKTWGEVERKLSDATDKLDALTDAARRVSHGDHFYDLDIERKDCLLCAAIEERYQPKWMDEPLHWLRDPIVKGHG